MVRSGLFEENESRRTGVWLSSLNQCGSFTPRLLYGWRCCCVLWIRSNHTTVIFATERILANRRKRIYYYELLMSNVNKGGPALPVTVVLSSLHGTMDIVC